MKYNYYSILKIFLFILLILSIILFNSFTKLDKLNLKESFVSNIGWPDELVQRFISYQRTVNLNDHQFDLDILQKTSYS